MPSPDPGAALADTSSRRIYLSTWTSERRILSDHLDLAAQVATNPDLAEDCRCTAESCPYITAGDQATEPIPCECCGTRICAVPEKKGRDGTWKRGIWETGDWRRHTLRRCNWKRGQRP
jgi:hypothetical protein